MCKTASFLYKATSAGVEFAVWDLSSHSKTQTHFSANTEKCGWYEGHYTPNGEIECRTPGDRDKLSEAWIKEKYPTFVAWFNAYCPDSIPGSLDLRGCDLKGIKLPSEIGGSLYLGGCDLKGVEFPAKIGGWLDLRGCDLKGIKLPSEIGGSLDLSGCDLKGVEFPAKIGYSLDLSGCDLKGIKLPAKIGGWLDLRGCDLKGIKLPKGIRVIT